MRLVVGFALVSSAGSALLSSPAIPMTILSVLLAAAAILLIIGLFTPIVGTLVALIESCRLVIHACRQVGLPPGSNLGRCPGNVRAGSMVGRCSPFWMEAHRAHASQEVARAPERNRPLPSNKPVFSANRGVHLPLHRLSFPSMQSIAK